MESQGAGPKVQKINNQGGVMTIKKVPNDKSFDKPNPNAIGKNNGVTAIVDMKGKGAATKGLKFKVRN
tara:strand:- start:409 stop:612 length:204 start_codon:yes stop_codon:yes gene_type:complete